MRFLPVSFSVLTIIAACSPDPGTTTTTDATTTDATGDTAGTATAGTATAGTATAGTATAGTATAGTATAGTATDVTTTDVTTTDSGTSGLSTGSTTTFGPDTDTGPGPDPVGCKEDADCKLADDCCDCGAVPIGVDHGGCDLACDQTQCVELGITAAVCRFGVCITPPLSCNPNNIVCAAAPPPCPPGTIPETDPPCWTGRCIPAKHCDIVETCDQCPKDRVCVQNVGFAPEPGVVCEPVPPACDPAGLCDCIGAQVCKDIYTDCVQQPDMHITCECPDC